MCVWQTEALHSIPLSHICHHGNIRHTSCVTESVSGAKLGLGQCVCVCVCLQHNRAHSPAARYLVVCECG